MVPSSLLIRLARAGAGRPCVTHAPPPRAPRGALYPGCSATSISTTCRSLAAAGAAVPSVVCIGLPMISSLALCKCDE